MIRPLTCICMLLAGGSGLYLYQSKHEAQMLDREVARVARAADAARERIGVLRGEWALLNEPDRLAALSQEHLALKTLTPGQFVTAAELGARLPPPVTPGAAPEPAGEDDASVPTATATLPAPPPVPPPAPSRTVAAAKPSPAAPGQADAAPPRAPAQVASALPLPAAPLPPPKPVPSRPVLAPVVNVSASPAPAPRPAHARAVPSAPDLPVGDAPVRMAQHVPAPAAPTSTLASASMPASVSALGGARPLLPPPVPYGSATAGSGASAR